MVINNMNYTKTIREYCNQNRGKMFDVSYEMKHHFEMVPYRTMCKILSRLEDEGLLSLYSKGLYYINTDENMLDPIIAFYASDYTGLVVGGAMYKNYGIINEYEGPIVIYTNAMETTTKNLGDKYTLIRFPVLMFDTAAKRLIEALEIIDNRFKYSGFNQVVAANVIIECLQYYNDMVFKDIIEAHQYQYSTICTLSEMLNNLSIQNRVMDIVKDVDK